MTQTQAFIPRTLAAFLAMLLSANAYPQDLSARDKVDIYGSCYPACQKAQRANPQNGRVLDTPFVLDAYCSCTCARMVFQLEPKEQVVAIARAQKQGRLQQYLRSDPTVSNLQTQNAAICQKALLGN